MTISRRRSVAAPWGQPLRTVEVVAAGVYWDAIVTGQTLGPAALSVPDQETGSRPGPVIDPVGVCWIAPPAPAAPEELVNTERLAAALHHEATARWVTRVVDGPMVEILASVDQSVELSDGPDTRVYDVVSCTPCVVVSR